MYALYMYIHRHTYTEMYTHTLIGIHTHISRHIGMYLFICIMDYYCTVFTVFSYSIMDMLYL